MKYFICELEGVKLGIPSEQTEKIIPQARFQTSAFETEGDETLFISLPVLFKLKNISAPHGLVLKSDKPAKNILLTPKIDIELEIPEENIHGLPESFHVPFYFLKGVYFYEQSMILVLDTEKLLESTGRFSPS
ncbi:MAG: hypothetical protein LBI12_07290 [Treponema sp.]|nr:hypothetical protein [Treponema sp.]